jgi:GNAT superfamily N-acetyltransferase
MIESVGYQIQMHIEPMTDADVAEVSALLRECFHWLADEEGFTDRQRVFLIGPRSSTETLRDEASTRLHLVARGDEGAIQGMAAMRENLLARLYVHPRYHGRGVGKALFNAVELKVREAGFEKLRVGALVENAAAIYRAMGMVEVGREDYEPVIFGDRSVTLLEKHL